MGKTQIKYCLLILQTYPWMKMIDMGFWQTGFELDINKGI